MERVASLRVRNESIRCRRLLECSAASAWFPAPSASCASKLSSRQWRAVASRAASVETPTIRHSRLPFLEFASRARDDVASSLTVVGDGKDAWGDRFYGLSSFAMERWPQEAPHWRVALHFALPPSALGAQRLREEISSTLAVGADASSRTNSTSSSSGSGTAGGLTPAARATCLRALCAMNMGGQGARQVRPLLEVLVDSGGVPGSKGGLAYQLPIKTLCECLVSVGRLSPHLQNDAAVQAFATEACKRLSLSQKSLWLGPLLDARTALWRCGIDTEVLDAELRARLQSLVNGEIDVTSAIPESLRTKDGRLDVVNIVVGSRNLNLPGILRGRLLRLALLPDNLSPADAAQIWAYSLPAEGAPTLAHEFVLRMAAERLASGARLLTPEGLSQALQGALACQLQGGDLALKQAALVLRALWPRVLHFLPHLGPTAISAAMRSYFWQLQFSRQEFALRGITHSHPIVDMAEEASSGVWRSRSPVKDIDAAKDLKAKLLLPMLERLTTMHLSQLSACLSAVAPPAAKPDIMVDADRALVRKFVIEAFPPRAADQRDSNSEWNDEFWEAEVQTLTTVEVLELACGLREAAPGLHDPGSGKTWWPLASLLAQLQERLRPLPAMGGGLQRRRPSVELSHFLLVRMCRVMDLWREHDVEEVLKHLLSEPDALRPLPIAPFVAVIAAMKEFSVPKELPLRLVAKFLDRVDCGELEMPASEWAELFCNVRAVDSSPSWERVTPRILQHLLPHLSVTPPVVVLDIISSLASQPLHEEPLVESQTVNTASNVHGTPIELAPTVVTRVACHAIEVGGWDFSQVVKALEGLGRLGWYDEAFISTAMGSCVRVNLLEAHQQHILPLTRACVALRVHHAPLLHKIVIWCNFFYTYLSPKPLATDKLDELLELADQFLELSFQSLDVQRILAENLKNPNASPRQVLGLLSCLARLSHFPPDFKESCSRLCNDSDDAALASLTNADLLNGFNIHLCAVFDGPAALKHWLTEDEDMKQFFQVHTSQKWYQNQDRERATFLQSPVSTQLMEAVAAAGLKLQPSAAGEVYHMELVSSDARERLSAWSNNPPTAVVCVKSKEQLRWYVPVTASEGEGVQLKNRCNQFHFMFRGAVQKIRHLQAMGYRVAVIWMSEWKALTTPEQRQAYLLEALEPAPGRRLAFSPTREEDAYV